MNNRILCVGDLHIPFVRKGYYEFCKDIYKKYKCNQVMFMGDVVDFHSVSFHLHNPELPNALDEYKLSLEMLKQWSGTFPKARVCIGNHCSRIVRLAQTVNIPSQLLRSYREIWDTPNWDWQWNFMVDGVYYSHGISTGALHPAYNEMRKRALSVVIGHNHSAAGLKYLVNPERRMFGLDTGCGIDDRQMAFAYNQFNGIRSVISAAVIINGTPYLEVMPMGKGEGYEDSKFTKGGYNGKRK